MSNGVRISAIIKLTDSERKLWLHNDTVLWDWWRRSGQPMDQFVSDNGLEIDSKVRAIICEQD